MSLFVIFVTSPSAARESKSAASALLAAALTGRCLSRTVEETTGNAIEARIGSLGAKDTIWPSDINKTNIHHKINIKKKIIKRGITKKNTISNPYINVQTLKKKVIIFPRNHYTESFYASHCCHRQYGILSDS